MASTIATAYVQLSPSMDGISDQIKKELAGDDYEPQGQSIGQMLGSGIKKAIIALGIGKLLKETISAALNEGSALEQSIGGIETLFKSSSDTMIQYAKQAYQTCGLSANEYMEQCTSFAAGLISSCSGDTAKAAEAANQAMIDMSDNANKMGTSMEDIQNAYQGFAKQNYTMLDNLKLGYGGTKTEMERLLKDAQELSGVEYNIDNLSDVYAAIHVIQEDLGITGTTAKEAATTFSGSFNSMKAAAQNLLGYMAVGMDIGPAISALAETTGTFIFGNFLPMLWQIVSNIPQVIAGLLSSAGTEIAKWGEQLAPSIEEGLANVPEVMNTLKDGLVSGSSALMEALPEMIAIGGELLCGLIDGISAELPGLIGAAADTINILVSGILNSLPTLIQQGSQIISSLMAGISASLPTLLTSAFDIVLNLASGLLQSAPDLISAGFELLGNIITGIIDAIPGLVEAGLQMVTEFCSFLEETDWAQTGMDIMNAIIDGIVSLVSNIGQAAQDCWNAIQESCDGVDWVALGTQLLTDVINGIASLLSGMWDVASDAAQQAWDAIKDTDWIQLGSDLLDDVISGIESLLTGVWDIACNVADNLFDGITDTDFAQAGIDCINGFINGIGSMAGAVWDAASNIAKSAFDSICSFFGIASPSKLMAQKVGPYIPEGIAVGIEANADSMTDAMEAAAWDTVGVSQQIATTISADPYTASLPAAKTADEDYSGLAKAIAAAIQEIPVTTYLNAVDVSNGLAPYLYEDLKRLRALR